ncbi:MAG: response regulator [Deltaproteobacteria bacterium]|jgi:signal transduction histidine kinase/ActR/RegA family two-component response regulator|nr:response regulator [Deltaproteobacteria bacterium]
MTSRIVKAVSKAIDRATRAVGMEMRGKLITIFLLVKVIPLIFLAVIAWRQANHQGDTLKTIAVEDSAEALNNIAVENIERMSTTAAERVADFLYARDGDILFVSGMDKTQEAFERFVEGARGRLIQRSAWRLSDDGTFWVPESVPAPLPAGRSTNSENEDMDGFKPRPPDGAVFVSVPLYDEITLLDLDGNETLKYVTPGTTKTRMPLSPALADVSRRENTYVKAEGYFEELKDLEPGEIYVSDVTGAYTGSNFIGMYAPAVLAKASAERGYDIPFLPEEQAYAGMENPLGRKFEGIVRWATPVADARGVKTGYVTLALNHDHIMEFVDHLTPMNERYTEHPSAYDGNYAFIWDYQCRSIAHPRHHSIVGFDPETGDPQVPWLEESIYKGWKGSGVSRWTDYVEGYPLFFEQSRVKRPAPELTRAGLVGLDGRYLNNAPQCTGWMDLTATGGSGSLYILWSGIYKLNTAAAIPYYTGQYAPSEKNGGSRRGFGFVAIGSGLESFSRPASETQTKLERSVADSLRQTFLQLLGTTLVLIVIVVFIAIWMASYLTGSITGLIDGISRFRNGERQFRFRSRVHNEFGTLADSFDDMADGIVESVRNPLSIITMDRAIIYMNDIALDFYGKSLDEVVGRPYSEVTAFPENTEYCPLKALSEGREAEIVFVQKEGMYLKAKASYLHGRNGERRGYIIESSDMTEMITRQNELEKAMNEAKSANEHKGRFLAHMSHEILTPMNAIIGLSGIVQKNLDSIRTEGPEFLEIRDNVRQIEVSSLHLLGLLNDILDLSKIEAGKIEISEEPVELIVLANTVTSIMKTRCLQKNIEFRTDLVDFTPSTFLTDPLHLRQVLINLLGNSVKFTPEGGRIEFVIKRKERRDGEALVEFTVRDTGIGISQEAMAAIFQPFEQGAAGITMRYGGTGLGLTISRHIVHLMGGNITVKSELGKGSEFSFAIWLRETESKIREEAPQESFADPKDRFKGKRLLLVDDVDLNRKIVKAMLKVTGIDVDEAEDGVIALKKFEDSPDGLYDIILMDVQMPNMDGYQASTAIRGLDRDDAKRVPIVALTANAFKEDIDRALDAGMNAHLAKPVKQDKIIDVMNRHMTRPA